MPPKSTLGFPKYMYRDPDRGGFRVRNPITGKQPRFENEADAREAARQVAEWMDAERDAGLLASGRPTFDSLIDKWITDVLPFKKTWSKGTKKNKLAKLNRLKREIGGRLIERTDRLFIAEYLASFCHTAETYMKWREVITMIYDYAISRKDINNNEAAMTLTREVTGDDKVRKPLSMAGYDAIYPYAAPWLQLAMDISLLTLQSRHEVAHIRHDSFKDGFLYVVRQKISKRSEHGFIKIVLTPDIEALRLRGATLDDTICPYVVHMRPVNITRAQIDSKPHWAAVLPNYITNAFADARDTSGFYAHLRREELPSFHEIRGLGSRIHLASNIAEEAISPLMTHADQKVTQIYLKGGLGALRPEHFKTVEAPLTLAAMRAQAC